MQQNWNEMLLTVVCILVCQCIAFPLNPWQSAIRKERTTKEDGVTVTLDEERLNQLLNTFSGDFAGDVNLLSADPGAGLENSISFAKKADSDFGDEEDFLSFQDSEVTPGLFQGDMAGINTEAYRLFRVALRWDIFPDKKWDNNTVPYYISEKYSPVERETIQTAVHTLGVLTCIKFVPYVNGTKDYLLFWPVTKPAGCWSFIGRLGGQQVVSLQQPDKQGPRCLGGGPGKSMHEIMHALGIFHEQSRADRDTYVTFNLDNTAPAFAHNFDKQSLENTTYEYDYDYNSIMHYGTNFFSRGPDKPTLVPIQSGVRIGQRIGISRIDCYKINSLYGCFDTPFNKAKYEAFCDTLGI